jgi:predicted amidophosphoribosyltransferase
MELILVWLILVIATGALAHSKGRSVAGWVCLSILIAPLTILILLALPNLQTRAFQRQSLDEQRRQREASEALLAQQRKEASDTKTCPRCAETIKKAALVCRFCGNEFPAAEPPVSAPTSSRRQKTCPSCSQEVAHFARACRHCSHKFDEAEQSPSIPTPDDLVRGALVRRQDTQR